MVTKEELIAEFEEFRLQIANAQFISAFPSWEEFQKFFHATWSEQLPFFSEDYFRSIEILALIRVSETIRLTVLPYDLSLVKSVMDSVNILANVDKLNAVDQLLHSQINRLEKASLAGYLSIFNLLMKLEGVDFYRRFLITESVVR